MSTLNMLERIVKALPRHDLEDFARPWNDRPWQADRKSLEMLIISHDSYDLRDEIADLVRRKLCP